MRRAFLFRTIAAAGLALALAGAAQSQEGFNPFAEPETARPVKKPADEVTPDQQKPYLPPMNGDAATPTRADAWQGSSGQYGIPYPSDPSATPSAPTAVTRDPLPSRPSGPMESKIERADLAPVVSSGDAGLPYELWQGLTVNEIEALLASLEIPPRSAALHALWMRLITTEAAAPAGDDQSRRLALLRAEALDRSSSPRAARDVLLHQTNSSDPVAELIEARTAIEIGEPDGGCDSAKAVASSTTDIPKRLRAEAIVLTGFCAAAAGNLPGAGIAAEMAQDNGLDGAAGPDMLNAVAIGAHPEVPKGRKLTLVDYRILKLGGSVDIAAVIPQAAPGLLIEIANDRSIDATQRLAAAEAAAALSVLKPSDLAAAYRAAPAAAPLAANGSANAKGADGATHRAAVFAAIENEKTPQTKTRHIRAFLDSARRSGFYWPALQLMTEPAKSLSPAPEIGWFTETAVEIAIASGDFERARQWVNSDDRLATPTGSGLSHWLALADIADAKQVGPRGTNLDSVERLALSGRFDADLLHRLATVLDALDTHIPITLWQAVSRTPQPKTGRLPETGVLTALQDASKKGEFGRTVLLAMKTLGSTGAEGAHIIALGDSIRALKRAGLEADARALALEALFAAWPREVSN